MTGPSGAGQTWHILGAGAIGCLWAAYLTDAGHRVELLLRDERQAESYDTANGFTIRRHGNEKRYQPTAHLPGAQLTISRLLVATKSYSTHTALAAWQPNLADQAFLMVIQNGWPQVEQLRQATGNIRLALATTTDGANRARAFRVIAAGSGQTRAGAVAPNRSSQMREELAELATAIPAFNITNTIMDDIWSKLLISAVINPLTAKYRCRNGRLPSLAYREIDDLCDEVAQIARAQGQQITAARLAQRVRDVCRATGDNTSSMLADVLAGNNTEIRQINGFLQNCAEKSGIRADLNRQLIDEIERLGHK